MGKTKKKTETGDALQKQQQSGGSGKVARRLRRQRYFSRRPGIKLRRILRSGAPAAARRYADSHNAHGALNAIAREDTKIGHWAKDAIATK